MREADDMRIQFLFIIVLMVVTIFGCSQGSSPMIPVEPVGSELSADAIESTHVLWGLWQFVCDPDSGTVDIVPRRYSDLHLNALRFLEPPAGLYLSLESPPQFTGNVLDIDIGLRHPFLGLPQFTGFDVCGILISCGSVTGFDDPDIIMKGEGDTRLTNADGYTRWWNPDEFPYNSGQPIYGYQDGLLGMSDDEADYNATLNGYKYFADSLDALESPWDTEVDLRGMFAAGQKNVRHYTIEMDEGFVFNYAIDANWKSCGLPPSQIEPPDSFAPEANRPEAWAVSITEIENTLYFEESTGIGGGELNLQLNVYDWFDADLHSVFAESLSGIAASPGTGPIDGGVNYSTYELDLTGVDLAVNGEIEILITIISENEGYGGLLPGKDVCGYFRYVTEVFGEGPQPVEGEFYIMSDKSAWSYEATGDDNPTWIRNMYKIASGEAASNDIVMFYYGHGGWLIPTHNQTAIFGWITNDGYTPVQNNDVPIDPTGCRMITMCTPGRWEFDPFSANEIAVLKQFINSGGILSVQAEVDHSDCWSTQETFNHLIANLGSGVTWAGNYSHPDYGQVWSTNEFDPDHPVFQDCTMIKWNTPSYLNVSKPTDNIIAWGKDGEAMMVESQVED